MAPKKTTPVSATEPAVPKTKTPTPVPEPVVQPPATAPATENESDEIVSSPMLVLEEKLALLSATFKEVNVQVRIVKKEIDRLRRIADRVEKKKASAIASCNWRRRLRPI